MTSRRSADTLHAQYRILGIFPHPDDEAYSVAGTFSQLIEKGAYVKLLCVTEGDAGTHRTMPEIRGANLAQVRRNELRKSAEVMGAQEVECMDLPDGGLANLARGELESVLAQKIDEFQPHVLVTLGIDGVYGHTDHVVLTQAVMDVCRRPEFSNIRLLHCAFPEGLFAPLYKILKKRARSLLDSGVELKDLGLSRDVCDVIVDVSQYAPTKRLCIEAHESQLLDARAESFLLPGLQSHLLLEEWFQYVSGPSLAPGSSSLIEGLPC